jgi:predicted nucleic acid-binding protein
MTVQAFVDSNVPIYAASTRQSEREKKAKAVALLANIEFGVSTQVLGEFYRNVRRGDAPMSATKALEWVERLAAQPCVFIEVTTVKRAIQLSERFQISYWDGAIIAAAEALGAPILYSEDLNHRQIYGSVEVINPFV